MKNPILRNGLYGSLAMVLLFLASYFMSSPDYKNQEIFGYLSICISLIFVFLGIKQYRDEKGGGYISFWQAVKVGLMIAAIPSITFGLYNLIYTGYIDPEFMDNYYAHSIEQMKATLPAEEFSKRVSEMEAEKEMFMSPIVQFGAMSVTVFLIGIIVSFVSSFILKKEKVRT